MARKPKPSGRHKSSSRGFQDRRVNTREPLQRFLIVCEGKETEPAYFDSFRVPSVKIKVIGTGKDPLTVVEYAHQRLNEERYDQVWCVFDRDDVPTERFNEALNLAQRSKIKIAYSNQAFELWYLLHFHYCNTAQFRSDYVDKLSYELGRTYQKNDQSLYQELLSRQVVAIQNAERLLAMYKPANPVADDPSTTIHKLVQELNKFIQDKRFA